jgi:hypothetical protein
MPPTPCTFPHADHRIAMGKAGKARKAGKALATAKVYQRQANHRREIMFGRLNVMGITSAVTVLASPDVKLGRRPYQC